MSKIKQQNTSQNALQKAEDNKKEITYIYSKLKNLTNELEQVKNNSGTNSDSSDNNQNNGTNNEQTALAYNLRNNNYCYTIGGIYTIGQIRNERICRPIYFYAENDGLINFNLTLRVEASRNARAYFDIILKLNDSAFASEHFTTNTGATVYGTGQQIIITGNVYAKKGINYFHAEMKGNNTSDAIWNYYYKLDIQSESQLAIKTNFMFYNTDTNGTQYVFCYNGGAGKMKAFETLEEFLNLDHSNQYNTNLYHSTADFWELTSVYMPALNETTNEIEKTEACSVMSYLSSYTVYVPSIKSFLFGKAKESKAKCAISEFNNNGNYGICLFYQTRNSTIALHKIQDGTSTTTYISTDGTEILGDIINIDSIKTITKTPMQNLQCVCYNDADEGYFVEVDCSGTTPVLNYNSFVKISDGIQISHTYFHNNLYYVFYCKNGGVYRKIFSRENNNITIISDEFFEVCEEIMVVNESYVLAIKNTYPFFIERCFYE